MYPAFASWVLVTSAASESGSRWLVLRMVAALANQRDMAGAPELEKREDLCQSSTALVWDSSRRQS